MAKRRVIDGANIFLSGGAGFIGSNFAELLVELGANVTVYDNLSSGRYEFIRHLAGRRGFRFVKGDLLEMGQLKRSIDRDTDMIIHLAANPDVALGTKRTRLDLEQGTIATYNVLEAGRLRDVSDFMFSSSSVVYGMASVRPTPEDYGPLLPISLYGASKLAGEGLITSFSHLFGMRHYIFRFANVVGKNSTHGVALDFARRLRLNPRRLVVLGDGRQRKSYIDVQDCVRAMAHIYLHDRGGCVYNLATDGQTQVSRIAKMVIDRFAPLAQIKYTGGRQGWPGDVPNAYLSNRRMKAAGVKLRYGMSDEVVSNFVQRWLPVEVDPLDRKGVAK